MVKLEKLFPVFIAVLVIGGSTYYSCTEQLEPSIEAKKTAIKNLETSKQKLNKKTEEWKILDARIKEMQGQMTSEATKKIYYPSEADLGAESVGFFLYSEVIGLAKENNIKIRSIEPNYDIKKDPFLDNGGRSNYYVCDLNMKLISNYKDLRNFIEALYQYEYYLKFNEIKITPYQTDKKILLTDFSIRLYSHTDVEKILPKTDLDL